MALPASLASALSIVSLVSFISLIGHIGFVGRISHNGLIGIIGLSLVSLIGIVGLIGFGFISLIGLDNLKFISVFGSSASLAHHLIIFFHLRRLINSSVVQASSTRSCYQANKHYRNRQRRLNLLCYRLVISRTFAHEGEDVVVARSHEEKDVVVDYLFWRILKP